MDKDKNKDKHKHKLKAILEVLAVSAKLGLTSFGGPTAHLGYFHHEYIHRRKWLDERSYADLIALCQFLPGPASSQVGIGIGTMRAGMLGGIAAFIGFTLPSILVLVLFASVLNGLHIESIGWLYGLKVVAAAIVAQAVLGMGQKLATGRSKATIAILTAVFSLLLPTAATSVVLIALAGLVGVLLYTDQKKPEMSEIRVPIRRSVGIACLVAFLGLLLLLPVFRQFTASQELALFDSFYRAGSLVFGGGHVVLPLIERELVPSGWISQETFLAGYGATQAVPGPLFTFASYLGAVMGGWTGVLVCTIGIFLPAILLLFGVLPFWDALRRKPKIQGALAGINAAVVGILLAAFYNPIWTSTVLEVKDFALAALLFGLLVFWKCPPWLVVILGAIGGSVIALI